MLLFLLFLVPIGEQAATPKLKRTPKLTGALHQNVVLFEVDVPAYVDAKLSQLKSDQYHALLLELAIEASSNVSEIKTLVIHFSKMSTSLGIVFVSKLHGPLTPVILTEQIVQDQAPLNTPSSSPNPKN